MNLILITIAIATAVCCITAGHILLHKYTIRKIHKDAAKRLK